MKLPFYNVTSSFCMALTMLYSGSTFAAPRRVTTAMGHHGARHST